MKSITLPIALLLASLISYVNAQDLEWANALGGTDGEYGRSIAVDDSGDVYITGFFSGVAEFDPSAGITDLLSVGGTDVFIAKYSGDGQLIWANRIGGAGNEYAYSVAVDPTGSVYVGGRFDGTVDMDPGTATDNFTSAGGADMFVLKLDAAGNYLWSAGMGGPGTDQINSLEADASGVYAAAVFTDSIDSDPGSAQQWLTSGGAQDFAVLHLNSSGNLQWAHQLGGTSDDRAYALTINQTGIFVSGVFSVSVDFDPGSGTSTLNSDGLFDAFVLHLDYSGNHQWSRSFSGSSYVFGYGITTDLNGNVYTTGYFRNSADFDPGVTDDSLTSNGNYDMFLSKLDGSGNHQWATGAGGPADDRGYSVATDQNGDVYFTGYFLDATDFDASTNDSILTPFGKADFYVSKVSGSGTFDWVRQFGGTEHDFGLALEVDRAGSIYVTGNFEGTADFDPSAGNLDITPAGGSDIFMMRIMQCGLMDNSIYSDANGLHAIMPGLSYRWLNCDNNNSVVPGENGIDFMPSVGGNYALEVSHGSCIDTSACYFYSGAGFDEEKAVKALKIFPNPAKDKLYISFETAGSANVRMYNVNGREVLRKDIYSEEPIDISSMPAGLYIIKVETEGQVNSRKLIIER